MKYIIDIVIQKENAQIERKMGGAERKEETRKERIEAKSANKFFLSRGEEGLKEG